MCLFVQTCRLVSGGQARAVGPRASRSPLQSGFLYGLETRARAATGSESRIGSRQPSLTLSFTLAKSNEKLTDWRLPSPTWNFGHSSTWSTRSQGSDQLALAQGRSGSVSTALKLQRPVDPVRDPHVIRLVDLSIHLAGRSIGPNIQLGLNGNVGGETQSSPLEGDSPWTSERAS